MKRLSPPVSHSAAISAANERAFAEVVALIQVSRERVVVAVNSALIDLYWRVGELVAQKIETDGWGKGTVAALSIYRRGIRDYRGSRLRTYGECGSSSRRTGTAQISQRC